MLAIQTGLFDPFFVDGFAGGGGASIGIERAIGRPIDIAINHDESAIMMHKRNHPFTSHYREDIWMIDPVEVTGGHHVRLAWFSPDCKHFSRAKGSALVDRHIRGLAWVVLRWAAKVKPDVIMLENVPEFVTWGPVRKGKPVKKKAGQTFKKWYSQLEALGYKIEYRKLCAADYGAPTIRTRFCLIARCDGQPIVWPERTHAPRDSEEVKSGKYKPWRAAAEIIDFSLPTYSIFESKETIKKKYGVRVRRPLKDKTLRRIARGTDKFVIREANPFIVPIGYGERPGQAPRVHDITQPLSTVVSSTKQYVCDPVLTAFSVECNHSGDGHFKDLRDPGNVITARYTGGVAEPVLSPYIMTNNSNNRPHGVKEPLPTITTGNRNFYVAPTLIQYHDEQREGEVRGQKVIEPIKTIDGSNRYALSSVFLSEYYGNARDGIDAREPTGTITSRDREGVTAAFMQKYYGDVVGSVMQSPLPTVTAIDHNALTTAHLAHFKGTSTGQDAREPLRAITSADGQFADVRTTIARWDGQTDLGYWPQVRELLNKYCGYSLADDEILLIRIGDGWYFISDIGLRMLAPRELYNAMGFPSDYIIDHDVDGNKISREDQVARCGNAVCPPLAEALVRANLKECPATSYITVSDLYAAMA